MPIERFVTPFTQEIKKDMAYKTQKEVEEEFDLKVWGLAPDSSLKGKKGSQIKQFISTLRSNDLDALIEHCEGMTGDYGSQGTSDERHEWANRAYLKACNDQITYLESLKKDLA